MKHMEYDESLLLSQHYHFTHQLLNDSVKKLFRNFMGAHRPVLVLDTDLWILSSFPIF